MVFGMWHTYALHDFISGFVVGHNHLDARLGDNLARRLHVGALQTDNDRLLEAQVLGRRHDTGRDHIAAHDAAENVDQDRLDLVIAVQDLEGLLHLLLGGASAHIQEVSGRAAVQRDDVHRGHGQTGSVHQTADVAVQANVVEVVGAGLHLTRVLLGLVALGEDFLVTEGGVVVVVELGVASEDLASRVSASGLISTSVASTPMNML
ncbi:hypothetical protein GQ600_1002 [Phytophthora cactorum]|nr:hypothetical protein GQ600_1002 [Phytophthora cactorum]